MNRVNCRMSLMLAMAALAAGTSAAQAPPLGIDALVDGYYSANPARPFTGQNQFHLFDMNSNSWNLSLARVAVDRDPDPLGLHVEVGYGHTYDFAHGSDTGPRFMHYVPQAYLKWKPAALKGLQLDLGKFYTSTGVEVLDTDQNWNYSRSLLFSWAQPGYHVGLRATVPVSKHFTAGAQLVNGWNNAGDTNSGKTIGLTATVSGSRITWATVYYAGPEKSGTNRGWRHLYDTYVTLTPARRVSLFVNLDHGVDRHIGGGSDQWTGISGAGRFTVSPRFALSSRWEWFSDADGFATGTPQQLKETTLTGEWKLCRGFLARLEYRRDWSDQPSFSQEQPDTFARSQNTVTLGLLAKFGIKR